MEPATANAFELGPRPGRLLAWAGGFAAVVLVEVVSPTGHGLGQYLFLAAFAAGAVVLAVAAMSGAVVRPRFRADANGVAIRPFRARAYRVRLAWDEIERVEVRTIGGWQPGRYLRVRVAERARSRRPELRAMYTFDLVIAGQSNQAVRERLRRLGAPLGR